MVLAIINDLSYFLIILIIGFVMTILSTLVYKYTTDQGAMKRAREEINKLRKKMKDYRHDQTKMMQINQEMMEHNMIIMRQSFKPMLYTIAPMLIIYMIMGGFLAFQPIMPTEAYTVTAYYSQDYAGDITLTSTPNQQIQLNEKHQTDNKNPSKQWILIAENQGEYQLLVEGDTFRETKKVIITEEKKYETPTKEYKDSDLEKIVVGNQEVKPLGNISLLGWKPGWIGTYILVSVLFSLAIRKLLGVV